MLLLRRIAEAKSPSRVKRAIERALRIAFVFAIIIVILFPIWVIIAASFYPYQVHGREFRLESLIPGNFTSTNYLYLRFDPQFALSIRNSVIVSLSNAIICLLVALPAAYAFTRATFRLERWSFLWIMLCRVAPPGAFIVPLFIIYTSIGLYDTLLGVVIAHSVFNLPLAIWMLTGFMRDIPTTVDEAAFVDGHSMWEFWTNIFLPLMLPAIGVTTFFLWMFSWTEVLLVTAVTQLRAYTMTTQLLLYTSGYTGFGFVAAAGVISMIPGLILLFFARRFIARGFMLGGAIKT